MGSVAVLEGQITADHREENHSAAPDVDLETCVLLARDHFRSCVTGRSTGSLQHFSRFVSIAQPKVYNFHPVFPVNQQVLRLKVAMDDTQFMNVVDAADDVFEESASFLLLQFALLDNVIKEFALLHILHYQKQVF